MKKLLTILVVIMMPVVMLGQQKIKKQPLPLAKFDDNVKLPLKAKERAQIIEVYGKYADKYVFNNSHRLRSIKHLLRNRVEIKMIDEDEDKKPYKNLSDIAVNNDYVPTLKRDDIFDPNTFNPLKYHFNLFTKDGGMYRVDGTNYYIIIKTQYQ